MYLDVFSAQGDTLTLRAWRDATYPFSPGKWVFGEPPTIRIASVGLPSVTRAQPANVLVDLQGPPPLHVLYILRDSVKGTIITTGTGTVATGSRFTITLPGDLTSKLTATFPYELTVIAYSDAVAAIDSSTQFLNVFDPSVITAPIQASVNQTLASLGGKLDSLSTSLSSLATTLATQNTLSTQSLKDSINTFYYLAGFLAVLQVVTIALVFTFRKR